MVRLSDSDVTLLLGSVPPERGGEWVLEYMAVSLPLGSKNPIALYQSDHFLLKKKGLRKHPLMWWAFISCVPRPHFFQLSNLIEKVGVVRAMPVQKYLCAQFGVQ